MKQTYLNFSKLQLINFGIFGPKIGPLPTENPKQNSVVNEKRCWQGNIAELCPCVSVDQRHPHINLCGYSDKKEAIYK